MCAGMARALEHAGCEVTRCTNGTMALDALTARPWDAMVSDIRMPGIDGRELLARALALRPELKVVLCTAFGTVEDAVEAIRRGASDYLLKPFPKEALAAAVRRALGPAPGEPAEGVPELVGDDPRFIELVEQLARAAQTESTILLTGESGTGKEVAARFVHARSARAGGPFIAVNCAALPGDLLEAELFGVRRGAYTGADRDRPGQFQRANGGTLLLDEIGELPLPLQAKLLRALEERAVMPLGAGETIPVDIRVIVATHRDLAQAVAAGQFRSDLYYRLRVLPLRMPALRERPADVPRLADHLAEKVAAAYGRSAPELTPEAVARLRAHPWPGNVRELRNVIERAVVLDRRGSITPEDLFLDDCVGPRPEAALLPGMTIAEMERRLIETTLDAAGGNRTRASEMLGISVRTLRNKLKLFREEAAAELSIS
jgi:DNA-binding NtrC family response regulator